VGLRLVAPSRALNRAAKAADKRRVLFERATRVHAPPAAWRAVKEPAEQAPSRGARLDGAFLLGKQKKGTRPEGRKKTVSNWKWSHTH
jgi:hypothetical protein